METLTSNFEWEVYNLKEIFKATRIKTKTHLISDRFFNSEFPAVEWELIIEINKLLIKENENCVVGIWLRQIGPNSINDLVNTKYRIYTIKDNKPFDISRSTNKLENQNKMGYSTFVLEEVISNPKSPSTRPLYFYCEVEIARYNPIEDLQNNYFKMFKEGIYTDFTFKVGGEIIKAHRCVLAQNCEYFKTMFEQKNMKEGRKE